MPAEKNVAYLTGGELLQQVALQLGRSKGSMGSRALFQGHQGPVLGASNSCRPTHGP